MLEECVKHIQQVITTLEAFIEAIQHFIERFARSLQIIQSNGQAQKEGKSITLSYMKAWAHQIL